MIYLLKLET